jgi:hypothetical protein
LRTRRFLVFDTRTQDTVSDASQQLQALPPDCRSPHSRSGDGSCCTPVFVDVGGQSARSEQAEKCTHRRTHEHAPVSAQERTATVPDAREPDTGKQHSRSAAGQAADAVELVAELGPVDNQVSTDGRCKQCRAKHTGGQHGAHRCVCDRFFCELILQYRS